MVNWLKISLSTMFFGTYLFQPQVIDSYITKDVYFPSRTELFQALTQDFQYCFFVGRTNRRVQRFFFYGQLICAFLLSVGMGCVMIVFTMRRRRGSSSWLGFCWKDKNKLAWIYAINSVTKCVLRVAKITVDVEKEGWRQCHDICPRRCLFISFLGVSEELCEVHLRWKTGSQFLEIRFSEALDLLRFYSQFSYSKKRNSTLFR